MNLLGFKKISVHLKCDFLFQRLRLKLFYIFLVILSGILLLCNLHSLYNHSFSIHHLHSACMVKESIWWMLFQKLAQSLSKKEQCLLNNKNGLLPIDELITELSNNIDSHTASECNPLLIYKKPNAGGRYIPNDCLPSHRILIVIPLRNRERHLSIFLQFIHPYLQRQNVEYQIIVVEQMNGLNFNRGMLMNIGFLEGEKMFDFDCCIFHDVDLIPEHDGIEYRCYDKPTHMSAAVDIFLYRIPYPTIFGGVENLSRKDFHKINGFSNKYFGWGAEDDDLYKRVIFNYLPFDRLPVSVARYKMLDHKKSQPSKKGDILLQTSTNRIESDGLKNITYNIDSIQFLSHYIRLKVFINQTLNLN